MTGASKLLFTTQSAVSQNIRQLEEGLGMMLFDRIGKRLMPTKKGEELFGLVRPLFTELEQGLLDLAGRKEQDLSGQVSIGVPVEYGNNVIVPLLSEWGKMHPLLQFQIRYGHADEMGAALLRGELDFAIVDSFGMDKRLGQTVIGSEDLVLCCHPSYLKKFENFKDRIKEYEKLDYIDYVSHAPVLKLWFRYHFGDVNPRLNIRASLMNVRGMSRMIGAGLGVGILPIHAVERLRQQKVNLTLFRGDRNPLKNRMSLTYLEERSHSLAVKETIAYLKENISLK